MHDTNGISISAYTRSEEKSKRVHVKVYDVGVPNLPKRVQIRVGDMCLHLDVNDANTLAQAIQSAVLQEAAA